MSLQYEICERFENARLFDRASFNKPRRYELYMRIGPRVFIDRIYRKALTLAAVTVERNVRRQGLFTSMVDEIERAARALKCDAVLVEDIQNPVVQHVLVRRRYRAARDGASLNMLLEVPE